MVINENHDIMKIYKENLQTPSQVLGIGHENLSKLQVPTRCCKKCGNCPEESEEDMGEEDGETPLNSSTEEMYHDKVSVDIDGLGRAFDIVDVNDTVIPYKINIDFRSWGINGIDVRPTGEISVNAFCTKYDNGEGKDIEVERNFKVNLDKLKVEYHDGRVIKPCELHLYIGPDHEVLYERSYIEFYMISTDF